MNCTRFDEELTAAAESRQCELPTVLHAHAEECPRCREALGDYELLDRAIVRWRAQVPAVQLADRVLAAFGAQAAAKPMLDRPAKETARSRGMSARSNPHAWLAVALAAASLLFLVWPMQPFPRDAGRLPEPSALSFPAHDESIAQAEPEIDLWLHDAAQYLSLADAGVTGLQEVTAMFPPAPVVPLTSVFEDEVRLPSARVQEWGNGLKPLSEGIGKAFEFLRHAIPETEPSTT